MSLITVHCLHSTNVLWGVTDDLLRCVTVEFLIRLKATWISHNHEADDNLVEYFRETDCQRYRLLAGNYYYCKHLCTYIRSSISWTMICIDVRHNY